MAAAVWAPMQMSCACVLGRGTAVIKHRNYHNHILLTVYTTSASEELSRNYAYFVFCLKHKINQILEKIVDLFFDSVI